MSNPKSGKRPPQQAVRVGQLEKTLERFNVEMGQKVALSLNTYHQRMVVPLERRVAELEVPWYRRAWLHAQGWWAALRPTVVEK